MVLSPKSNAVYSTTKGAHHIRNGKFRDGGSAKCFHIKAHGSHCSSVIKLFLAESGHEAFSTQHTQKGTLINYNWCRRDSL